MGKIKKIGLSLILLVGFAFVASCYVPDDFTGDVTIDKNGNYVLDYDGILTWTPYYGQIKQGKLTGEEMEQKIAATKADLARDPNFTEIKSIGNAQFRVKYHREGKLKPSSLVSFVRRDSLIMKIQTNQEDVATFSGRWITPEKAEQLDKSGLKVQGVFKVKTNAEVISSNSEKVTNLKDGFRLFYWKVEGLSKTPPALVLRLKP